MPCVAGMVNLRHHPVMTPQDSSLQQDTADRDSVFETAFAAHRAGNLAEAIAGYIALLQESPHRKDALNNLGVAFRQSGRCQAAEICYRRLLVLEEPNAGLCVNLANCLRDQGKIDEASTYYRRAIDYDAESASAWHGLGLIERDLENLEESVAAFDKAIALSPDGDQYTWDRSLSLLRLGDYRAGFEAYESRWTQPGQKKPSTQTPEWDGTLYQNKTLLLYGEQGFGDVIQFTRFIPLAVQRGGTVILSVRSELVSLLQDQFHGVHEVVSRDDPVPAHDFILPLLSLPRVLGTEFSDLTSTPYLKPKSRSVALPERSSPHAKRVAMAWAGSPTQKNDRNRSFPLLAMAPLLVRPGIDFFAVQKGPGAKQIVSSGLAYVITDISSHLDDFADTSAALAEMDLIISCDSAVVHLAGALGKPVWVALSVFHDWRYGPSGDLTPWYGTSRVFKQTSAGDWAEVFDRMSQALDKFSGAPS